VRMLAFEWPFCRIWEAAEFEMEGLDDSPSKCSPQAVLSCTKTLVESAAKKVHTACTAFGHLLSSAGRSALLQLQASCSAVLGLLQQCSQALGSGTQALGSGMLKCVTDLLSATGSALAAALSHTKATMSACTAGSTAAVGSAFCSALTCVRELLIQAMSSIGSACQAMVKSPAWCLAGTANCLTAVWVPPRRVSAAPSGVCARPSWSSRSILRKLPSLARSRSPAVPPVVRSRSLTVQ
jgi:hypothetical protein